MLGHASWALQLKPECFWQTSHQVQILHCRAARAFAEIVEHGDQPRLAAVPGAEHIEIKPVVGSRCTAKKQFFRRIVVDIDHGAVGIMIAETITKSVG